MDNDSVKPGADAAFDVGAFRRALGTFVTGVTVVTTRDEHGQPRGFTANSFTSVSLSPPLVLICIGKQASSYEVFSNSPFFAVNILADMQKGLAGRFASKVADKFADVEWSLDDRRSPILHGVTSWFDCARHDLVDAGDHVILIGRVLDFSSTAAEPLAFCSGSYLDFSLYRRLVAAEDSQRVGIVGAILEQGDAILFERRGGKLRLPSGTSLGIASQPETLIGRLAAAKLDARPSFVFSIFERSETRDRLQVYYRGSVSGQVDRESYVLCDVDGIPWEEFSRSEDGYMVRRYVRERAEGLLRLYIGQSNNDGHLYAIEGAMRTEAWAPAYKPG